MLAVGLTNKIMHESEQISLPKSEEGAMNAIQRRSRSRLTARALARALGWFSIALGAAELIAPGSIKKQVGAPGPRGLLQAYGLREIAAGVAILGSRRPVDMVWTRVAGDLLDLATLLPSLSRSNPHRLGGIGAVGFVALATAVDLCVALQGEATRKALRRGNPEWPEAGAFGH